MILYVAVFLGCLIYILIQLNGRLVKPDFQWKIFVRTNVVPTVINLIVGFALVLGREELINIFPITFLTALLLGLSGQTVIKKLSDTFNSKVPTKIGL